MPEQLALGIAAWMAESQKRSGGRIVCPGHQTPGTYADGFAALVFWMLGMTEPGERALSVSLKRSPESEFDSLAQALMSRLCPESLGCERREELRNRPLYTGAAIVSNNWALFRGLTRRLRGEDSPEDERLLALQFPSGLFPDSPVGTATPTCYHAKICAVLALRLVLCGDESVRGRLHSGLSALSQLITPQGYVVPYGRSRNTLFGAASAYLALRIGSLIFDDGSFAAGAQAVLGCLGRYQQPDGHIPAVLNEDEWVRRDWDVYINNPDYNAFAAACLLLAARLAPNCPEPQAPAEDCRDLGPLLVCRRSSGYFACATTGEYAPYNSPFFCDTRYAGMVPLVFDDGSRLQRYDSDYCWDGRDSTRACLVDPRRSDWTPYFESGRTHYWVRNYESISWSLEGQKLSVVGEGVPLQSSSVPRWRRFLAGRLSQQPVAQTRDRRLSQRLKTELVVDFEANRILSRSFAPGSRLQLRRAGLEGQLCMK